MHSSSDIAMGNYDGPGGRWLAVSAFKRRHASDAATAKYFVTATMMGSWTSNSGKGHGGLRTRVSRSILVKDGRIGAVLAAAAEKEKEETGDKAYPEKSTYGDTGNGTAGEAFGRAGFGIGSSGLGYGIVDDDWGKVGNFREFDSDAEGLSIRVVTARIGRCYRGLGAVETQPGEVITTQSQSNPIQISLGEHLCQPKAQEANLLWPPFVQKLSACDE